MSSLLLLLISSHESSNVPLISFLPDYFSAISKLFIELDIVFTDSKLLTSAS